MATPIRKIKTLAGTTVYQVDGRRYNASPARPQFPTKEAAETALAEMIAKRGAGLSPTRRDVTFAMQAESYLKNNADTLADRTLRSYASSLKAHILPRFGAKRLIEINTPMIKTFLTEKRAKVAMVKIVSGPRGAAQTIPAADFDPATMKRYPADAGSERQLGAAAISLIRATLSVVLQSAVDDGLIQTNPVAAARNASRGRKARAAANQAVAKERPFTHAQQNDLLEWCEARDRELGDFLVTLLRTGCRPGEARALRWGDIIGDKLLIERSADDRNVITPTKTGNKRTVDMSPALKDVLRLRLLKRPAATPTDYVFGNGEPIPVRTLARRFELALKECKITGHVMYDCRHTFASTLLARSRDVVYAAKMLGHSDPGTTLKHYAHFMEAESARYVDLLDEPAAEREREEMKAST
jgi:integrase